MTKPICWIASYPKSGNTWVRMLLSQMLGPSAPENSESPFSLIQGISSDRRVFDDIAGLPSSDLSSDEIDLVRPDLYRSIAHSAQTNPIIKVHDCYHCNAMGHPLFPADVSHGTVYIVRNPLDIAVSYAHHRGEQGFNKTINLMADQTASIGGHHRNQLQQRLGRWCDHVHSWLDQTDIPVLLVRYEDLLADTVGELERIMKFLDIRQATWLKSPEQAVTASRFDTLQELERRSGFEEKNPASASFFRSGKSGDGMAMLSANQQEEIRLRHGAVMDYLGYTGGDRG